jgi:hypothetical protein
LNKKLLIQQRYFIISRFLCYLLYIIRATPFKDSQEKGYQVEVAYVSLQLWTFGKLNTHLRTQARTHDALVEALRIAVDWITETDAKNWFAYGGHHVH